ncbi:MAG: hypothetical protein LBG44_07745, partial [Gemmatimonadota bacterium]|nr:hypothetical protein [Gemmatimonadota bacterium]
MSTRNYHIVACAVPVVYTLDGDVDVNGMVFVPKAFEPMLEWFKDLWYYSAASVPSTSDQQRRSRGKSEQLPMLHHRRQRVELVIHGLERLNLMVQRLAEGCDEDRALLAQLIALEHTASNEQCDHYLSDPHHDHRDHWRYHASDRARAVRMNIERQITELQIALTDLRNTRGLPRWRSCEDGTPTPAGRTDAASLARVGTAPAPTPEADAEPLKAVGLQSFLAAADVADPFNVIPIRLVSLTSRQRMEWRDFWIVQRGLLDHAIQQWFETFESNPAYGKTLQALAKAAGLPGASKPAGGPWIQRLLLNDHRDPNHRSGPCDRFNPMKPIPLLRPLVLRACKGETVTITLENSLERRPVGFFIQGDHGKAMATAARGPFHPGVARADGSHFGDNADSRCAPGQKVFIQLKVEDEGVWPINDLADVRGNPDGTNAHGLFGALIVEPPRTHWLHAETGDDLTDAPWATMLDVIIEPQEVKRKEQPTGARQYIDLETDRLNGVRRSFREFTVFIHDEPETHSGLHTVGDHSIMPLSYRAEPMHNRAMQLRRLAEQTAAHPRKLAADEIDRRAVSWDLTDELDEVTLTAKTAEGEWLEYIAGEEQHHSSWLFGDPVTHIQRAYAGDPCRVRLVHAGVKETHIYHLHVHEWHAVRTHTGAPSSHGESAYDDEGLAKGCDEIVVDPVYGKVKAGRGSHLLDSITISPQTGMTIDPLFGSGSRQHAIGDIVWHCHLYPHFHHGMWGLWRSHDRLVDGSRPYPDGSYCPPLAPLPDKQPPASTVKTPGFPWFIDGIYPAKSPPPPAARHEQRNGRRIKLRMGDASVLERAAMAEGCRSGDSPGALFVDLDGLARKWNAEAGLKTQRKLSYDIEVRSDRINYNVDGWHDPRGHRYRLMGVTVSEKPVEGEHEWVVTHTEQFPYDPKANPEPCFPRANHGDIVEWRQHNNFTRYNADQYDFGQLPVECGLHVHLVKFDVLAADGSATGWNYISGASCREMVGEDGPGEQRTVSLHRWVVDEEFGPCFFHDHLLANHRQKRGLFSALMVQPQGSQWQRHDDQSRTAWHEPQAVIIPPESSMLPPYREACLGVADYVPLVDKHIHAINPPPVLGGMSDPGVMGVNYRCAPMRFRGADPSLWFSSAGRRTPNFAGEPGDPDTPIIQSYPGERLRIRLIQGSHEEQHSFTAHGLRWRRD